MILDIYIYVSVSVLTSGDSGLVPAVVLVIFRNGLLCLLPGVENVTWPRSAGFVS